MTRVRGRALSGSRARRSAELRILVGARFVVTAHADKLKVAQIKQAFEKVALDKRASWKDEGLAK